MQKQTFSGKWRENYDHVVTLYDKNEAGRDIWRFLNVVLKLSNKTLS